MWGPGAPAASASLWGGGVGGVEGTVGGCGAASVGGANRIARNGRVVCYRAQSGRHSRCGS
ncbi:hypothetical protein DIS09_34520 [Burkholderia pseudomallei]|nr:hypothetical protein DIS09_34520 [Burkholderia pseudomallei]